MKKFGFLARLAFLVLTLAFLGSLAVIIIHRLPERRLQAFDAARKAMRQEQTGTAGVIEAALPLPSASVLVPVGSVTSLSGSFYDDPASVNQLEQKQAGLKNFQELCQKQFSKEAGYDFLKIAEALGLSFPAGDKAGAAAAVRRYLEANFGGLLAEFRRDLHLGVWDFEGVKLPSFSNSGFLRLAWALDLSTAVGAAAGDAATALAQLADSRLAAKQISRLEGLMGSLIQNSLNQRSQVTLSPLLGQGIFSEAQLRQLLAEESKPLQSLRAGLVEESACVTRWTDLELAEPTPTSVLNSFSSMLEQVTGIADYRSRSIKAKALADLEDIIAQISPSGSYRPDPNYAASTSQAWADSQGWLDKLLLGNSPETNSVIDDVYARTLIGTVKAQTREDLWRLSLGLELAKTVSGKYPPSLNELAGEFPQGLPLDPTTKALYHYERTTTGYRIWAEDKDAVIVR
jgi:hypothetical protein